MIENAQRDINIALRSTRLATQIFDRIGIDISIWMCWRQPAPSGTSSSSVPGLVGGHCIGVDPFYLTHKAEMLGYHPQVILAGRRINDGMGKYIAEQTIKQMIAAGSYVKGARVTVLGLSFKENCADLRNSKVADVIRELKSFGVEVCVHDPVVEAEAALHEYGVTLLPWDELPRADALVAAVAHDELLALDVEALARKLVRGGCFIDVKGRYDAAALKAEGLHVWRL